MPSVYWVCLVKGGAWMLRHAPCASSPLCPSRISAHPLTALLAGCCGRRLVRLAGGRRGRGSGGAAVLRRRLSHLTQGSHVH